MKILTLKVDKVNLYHLQKLIAENIPDSLIIESSVTNVFDDSKKTGNKKYKNRFIVKLGDTIKSINITEIAYFYTENKINFICTVEGQCLPIDLSLDQVEAMLNPDIFFRINRQFIVGHHAIGDMKAHTRSRIKILLIPPYRSTTIVAIDRAPDFKSWLSE